RIYAPELLMGIKTYEEEMDAIIDVTPEPVNTAPQTLDSIKQNVVKETPAVEAPAEKPKRSRQPKVVEEEPMQEAEPTTNDSVSVEELKRLQAEAEALIQKKQPSSAEMKKEYAKALNTAKSLADVLDIEEQIENDSALNQADAQYLQANIEQVRAKFETSRAPAVDPIKSTAFKNGMLRSISDAQDLDQITGLAPQITESKDKLTSKD